MEKLVIGRNDGQQRLDRFLRKYLKNASLGSIYKFIRKDVKVNGKRVTRESILQEGDEITLYFSPEDLERYTGRHSEGAAQGAASDARRKSRPRKSFGIVYEDENILAAAKPYGLLTHGDGREKKNTLVNQVVDYLIEKGEYIPRIERSFTPAAVNRLDRNTTGLVLFGKNAPALRALNEMIRSGDMVSKYYLTVLAGELPEKLHLKGTLVKDEERNTVAVGLEAQEGKTIETIARPLFSKDGYTLAEIELVTGRTHQIRAHMASAGYPVLGDAKYGDKKYNAYAQEHFGLKAQLLHAYCLRFHACAAPLKYLAGQSFYAELPAASEKICRGLFGNMQWLKNSWEGR